MIPPFPFRFRNAEILTVYWRTDPAAMAFLLPPPLRPEGDVACCHIYKMNDTDWLGPYAEANVMFGASLGDRHGAYSPYLVLSSDIGVAHGREIHGQPKKLGKPTLEARGDLFVGTVERNGIDVSDRHPALQTAPLRSGPAEALFRLCHQPEPEGHRPYRRHARDPPTDLAPPV